MIKILIEADYEWLFQQMCTFNDQYFKTELHTQATRVYIKSLLDSAMGVAFRSDNGFIFGALELDPLRGHIVLKEHGWYCTDGTGIRLLKEFIRYGNNLGVHDVRVSTLSKNKRVGRVLERMGFTELETTWVKPNEG